MSLLLVCWFIYSFLVYLATLSVTEEDHEKAQVR
jgi:succinate-acetate transporter protein